MVHFKKVGVMEFPVEQDKEVEGRTLLRTDENGRIQLSTNSQQLWVEVERK